MNLRKWKKMVVWSFVFFGFFPLAGGVVDAQYPDKPITVIVPWPPGGASDVIPRTLSKPISEELKQPAAIEELMVGLHILLGFETNYKLDRIGQLCKLVRDLSGVQPANNKPVIGEENYTRESGIGVDLVMKNPLAMFATNPQLFGREGKVVLGKKSGKTSITYTLEKLGIKNVSDEAVTEILKEVKAGGTEKRALLSIDEFREIVNRRLK